MKTQSLTPWCNLYSSALKYNITVRKSLYKLATYSLLAIVLLLVIVVSFTFYYTLALSIAVVSIVMMGVYLSLYCDENFSSSFLLSTTGEIFFKNHKNSYQLAANSRLSFIGCWLVMIPKQSKATTQLSSSQLSQKKSKEFTQNQQVFIFRDSLSNQDFSRLANIIKKLA